MEFNPLGLTSWGGRMSATGYKKRYLDALLDLLWRQWRRMGVAGR